MIVVVLIAHVAAVVIGCAWLWKILELYEGE